MILFCAHMHRLCPLIALFSVYSLSRLCLIMRRGQARRCLLTLHGISVVCVDIGGRFVARAVICGLVGWIVTGCMRIRGVVRSSRTANGCAGLYTIGEGIYHPLSLFNDCMKLMETCTIANFQSLELIFSLWKYVGIVVAVYLEHNQHFRLMPIRNSSSRISNMTWIPTNNTAQQEIMYATPE